MCDSAILYVDHRSDRDIDTVVSAATRHARYVMHGTVLIVTDDFLNAIVAVRPELLGVIHLTAQVLRCCVSPEWMNTSESGRKRSSIPVTIKCFPRLKRACECFLNFSQLLIP